MKSLIAFGLAALLSFGSANVATAGAPATASSYSGIIGLGGEAGDQGKISITISPTGTYTLRGKIAGIGFTNKGEVSENGMVSDDFVIKLLGGFIRIPVHLEFVVSLDGKKIDGFATFSFQGDTATLGFTLYRSAKFTKNSPAPQAGRYVMVLSPSEPGQVPGRGVATINVSVTGNVIVNGMLADGAKISCGGKLSEDGIFPILNVLYGRTGYLTGFAQFGETPTEDALSWARFTKQGVPIFGGELEIGIHPYMPPAAGSPAINFGNTENTAPLSLGGGGLTDFPPITLQVSDKNKVTVLGENESKLELQLNKKTGLISGSIKLELGDTTQRRTIKLVILQENDVAVGFFVSPVPDPVADLGVL
jgi:hypothetical protein